MAEQRIENGALRIDKLKLNFTLDDQGLPIDCAAYERKAANSLIEEVRTSRLLRSGSFPRR